MSEWTSLSEVINREDDKVEDEKEVRIAKDEGGGHNIFKPPT